MTGIPATVHRNSDRPEVYGISRRHALSTPEGMSSLLIAEITGKRHDHVMSDIRRILAEAEIDQKGFLSIFKDSYNRDQPCFLLPRRECDLVVSGYSVLRA